MAKKDIIKNLKFPRVTGVFGVVSGIISLFQCNSWPDYLQKLILPHFDWWILKFILNSPIIILGYVIPLYMGTYFMTTSSGFLQLTGVILVGIGFGIVLRICLVFMGVIFPY